MRRHRAVQHVEELHLAGLDHHALRRHALAASIERGDDRADLALEEPRAQHAPALRGAVERDDRVVLLAAHLDAARGLAGEERRDRHAEGGRDAPQRVQRRREPTRLDLRHHARREVGLLRQLPLLQVALEPQRLDPLAQRHHVEGGGPENPGRPSKPSKDEGPTSRPASRASARATYTRTRRFRYGCVKSVLSSGFAGPAAASAARVMLSEVRRCPTSAVAAAAASRGVEATAPSTTRASRTTSPSRRSATATPSTGKSNEPRRRNFRYTESQPSAGGSASSVRISSGRLARYAMPSSW